MTRSSRERRLRSSRETSRMINENRLRLQEERMNLIEKLKDEVLVSLKEELKDKNKYKKLMKELIVQVAEADSRV